MKVSAPALERAINTSDLQLAVFDVDIRRRTDQWKTGSTVALGDVIDTFQEVPGAYLPDGRLLIPLHEPDAAELTGEAVIVDPDHQPPVVTFFDFSAGGRVSYPLDELASTVIGWQCRFWTSAFEPSEIPEYLKAIDEAPTVEFRESSSGPPGDEAIWIDQVRSAVIATREEKRSIRRSALESPNRELVIEHGGLVDLISHGRHADEYGQVVVTLGPPEDAETGAEVAGGRVNSGDDVIVASEGVSSLPVEAAVLSRDGREIQIGIYWDTAADDGVEDAFSEDAEHRFFVAPLIDATPYEAVEQALRSLERRERATRVYAGIGPIRFDDDLAAPTSASLNREQLAAVTRALTAEDVCCIHAPPWTGARRTIHHIISESIEDDRTVGIFAPTASALSSTLGTTNPSLSLTTGQTISCCWTSESSPEVGPFEADVIAYPLDAGLCEPIPDLDIGIVDHAARIDVAKGAIPFVHADRVVLVGDHAQLPPRDPLTGSANNLPGSIYSHIAHAYEADVVSPLRCQYAMNQAIAMYSNERYYGGQLLHGQDNRTWTIDTLSPVSIVQTTGTPRKTPTDSWFDTAEVEAVTHEVNSLVDRGVAPGDLCVIAPTSAQIGKLRADLDEFDGIAVGSPELFTCTNRRVAIVSLLSGDPAQSFWSHHSLNVALTRATRRLVLVGNWSPLADATDQSGPLPPLYQYLTNRGLID